MNILKYGIVLFCTISLWGCGTGNSSAPATADPVTKKVHADPTWLATAHRKTPASMIPTCAECHGGDFKGGIVNVSCTKCHPNGPQGGPPHPIDGVTFLPASQHGAMAKLSLAYCSNCHSNGANQPFNALTILGSASGCALCHSQNPNLAHPYGWIPGRGGATTSHATAGDMALSCGLCHGAALDGNGGIAPSCSTASLVISGVTVGCHANGNPVTSPTCTSCHGNPPTTGRHAKHFALPGMTTLPNHGGCAICHREAGAGTLLHANGTANTSAPFEAKFRNVSTTTATYDPTTGRCSNISCHGGQVFPTQLWTNTTPVLDPADATTCILCHRIVNSIATNLPYIWPISGNNLTNTLAGLNLHKSHIDGYRGLGAIKCTQCHNLSVHFSRILQGRRDIRSEHDLTAPSVGGVVADPGGYVTSYTYTSPTSSSCVNTCHVTRSWFK